MWPDLTRWAMYRLARSRTAGLVSQRATTFAWGRSAKPGRWFWRAMPPQPIMATPILSKVVPRELGNWGQSVVEVTGGWKGMDVRAQGRPRGGDAPRPGVGCSQAR